jgi:hypothetical protein
MHELRRDLATGLSISSRQICAEKILMSRGPGRIQRAVIALIESDPDGVWTTAEICRRVYPDARGVAKKHRVAVLCALRRVALPGTWAVRWVRRGTVVERWWAAPRLRCVGTEFCLYHPCSDESQARVRWLEDGREPDCDRWKERFPYLVERAKAKAADARRWRDASTAEKLDIQIAEAQQMIGLLNMAGAADAASIRPIAERIMALQASRAKLMAPGE